MSPPQRPHLARAAPILLFLAAYAASTAVAWRASSFAGGVPGGSAPDESSPCERALWTWKSQDLRARVASGAPTRAGFVEAADKALGEYASMGCPFGAFLAAAQEAREAAASQRGAGGLARQ